MDLEMITTNWRLPYVRFYKEHIRVLTSKRIVYKELIMILYSIYLLDDSMRSILDTYDGLIQSRRMAIWVAINHLVKEKAPIKTMAFTTLKKTSSRLVRFTAQSKPLDECCMRC